MPAARSQNIDDKLAQFSEENAEQIELAAALAKTSDEKDADTRQKVAMWCVIGYFAGLILILIGVPIYNYLAVTRVADQTLLLDLKDTLLTYQAVVGTLVGAVVAYYFKTQLEKSEN